MRSDESLFLFFLLLRVLFKLCNVIFIFGFVLFFLEVKFIKLFFRLIDLKLFVCIGGFDKFLFDVVGVGVGVEGFL